MQGKSPNSLRFDHTPDQMQEITDEAMKKSDDVLDAIVAVPKDERTWANSILPMAQDESEFSTMENNITFYHYVSMDKELRDKSIAVEEKMDAWSIKQGMRLDVYQALSAYREVAKANGEWDKLTPEQHRYVNKCILDKERNGLGLPEEQREAVAAVKKEIADLERKASQNINEDKTKVECAITDLDGLKEEFIKKLEKVEGKEGHVYISLKYPEIFPALKMVKNADIRAKLSKAKESQCRVDNAPLLEELVTKR